MPPRYDDPEVPWSAYVLHWWGRRLALVAIPILTAVLVWGVQRFAMDEEFQANALIQVRERPSMLREGPKFTNIDPPAYKDILLNDELIRGVIEEIRRKYPETYARVEFERMRQLFSISVVTTRDTAVSTTYSPILRLSAKASSREVARDMVALWVGRAIERYGDLMAADASALYDQTEARAAELAEQVEFQSARLSELDRTIEALRVELHGIYGQIAPAAVTREESNSKASVILNDTQPRLNLFDERARIEMEIAAARAQNAATLGELEARLAAVKTLIESGETRAELLRGEIASLTGERHRAEFELNGTLASVNIMNQMRGYIAGDRLSLGAEGQSRGDLRILANPVTPEKRTGLPRTLVGMVAGVAMGLFLMVLFAVELYLRRVTPPTA